MLISKYSSLLSGCKGTIKNVIYTNLRVTFLLQSQKERNLCFYLTTEPTLKSKACLKCLYFTIIIFDLCRYLEYFSYLYTINQTE